MKLKKPLLLIAAAVVISTTALIPNSSTIASSVKPTDIITRAELNNILNNYQQKVEQQTIAMVNKTTKSSVLISAVDKNTSDTITWFNKDAIQGSGFFIGDRYIITNNHVVGGLEKVVKIKTDDNSKIYNAKVIYTDEGKDLALIEIQDYKSENYIVLGTQPKPGQSIFTVGNPGDFTFTVMNGMVSKEDSYGLTQLNMGVEHGSSGSPIVDNQGRLVGVLKSRSKDVAGVSFAIKVDDIKWFVHHCVDYGKADLTQINEFLGLTSHQ